MKIKGLKRPRRLRRWQRFSLSILIGFVFLIVGAELLFPLFWPDFRPIIEPDPQLGYRLKPNSRAVDYSCLFGEKRTVWYDVGPLGERSSGANPKTDPQKRLIFCFGDSNTFGMGLQYKETLPAQMNRFLGSDFSVVNFGVPGHNGKQVCRHALLRTEKYSPDLVVLQICSNDDEPPFPIDRIRSHRLLDKTRIGVVLALMMENTKGSNTISANDRTAFQMTNTLDELRKRDIPAVLLVHSLPAGFSQRLMARLTEQEQTFVFDAQSTWKPTNILKSSRHLNAKGNAIVAGALTEIIQNNLNAK